MKRLVGYIYLMICLIVCLMACKKDVKSPEVTEENEILVGTPTLLYPYPNEPCLAGPSANKTHSAVEFRWFKASKADVYEIVVKNLISGEVRNETTADTATSLSLLKNTPFSWYIKASNSSGSSRLSETYKFYNGGDGAVNYVPFPAEALSPLANQNISAASGKVIIKWKGSDIDNDIVSYDLYLGTSKPEVFLAGNLKTDLLEVDIKPNMVYYWRVVCKDAKGNSSTSESFTFTTD